MTLFDDYAKQIAMSMFLRSIEPCFAKQEIEIFGGVPEMYRDRLPDAVENCLRELIETQNHRE